MGSTRPHEPSSHALLYDADCGFCRWALGWVLRWDRYGRVRPVALQAPDAPELLPGMTAEERMASWHLVGPDDPAHTAGGARSAGAAAAPLLRLLPCGAPLAALCERFPRAIDVAYAWVVRHRSRFGQLVSAGPRGALRA